MKKAVSKMLMVVLLVFTVFLIGGHKVSAVEPNGSFYSATLNGRNYKYYIPANYTGNVDVPMFVMLHGATQTANTFAEATQMNQLADEKGFIVLYPEQSVFANASRSWNWFYGINQLRGYGEAEIIASMVRKLKNDYRIDGEKVFVSGLSAGGAMAVIMAVTYPDLIKGVAVAAGLEFNAALSLAGATTAMLYGGPSPTIQGQIAYNNMPSGHRRLVPTLVFHGTADLVVNPINGNQVLSQFARLNDLVDDGSANGTINDAADQILSGQVSGGRSYTRYIYHGNNQQILMEKYLISGMGHAWSGGKQGASYSDPTGPNMSLIMYNFFLN